MLNRRQLITQLAAIAGSAAVLPVFAASKEIAYLTPSLSVSFWRYVAAGVEAGCKDTGLTMSTMNSNNKSETQLQNAQAAIAKGVAGIVLSPVDSASAPAVLSLAEKAGIPVVICDVGTTGGTYAAFVTSDNLAGARGVGDAAGAELKKRGWTDGSFGIIGIPQARKNGQLRSKGFRDAMAAVGMKKEVALQEMQTFTADESFKFAQDMLAANTDLRVIFVQSDQQALGVARAVKTTRRADSVLVAAFDGTPELLTAIIDGSIVGAGMQQPHLMGVESSKTLAAKLGGSVPTKEVVIPIMTVTASSAKDNMSKIKLNVFANAL